MLAVKRAETLKNCLGVSYVEHNVLNELPENDQIQAGDQLVCYGRYKDFQKFWNCLLYTSEDRADGSSVNMALNRLRWVGCIFYTKIISIL